MLSLYTHILQYLLNRSSSSLSDNHDSILPAWAMTVHFQDSQDSDGFDVAAFAPHCFDASPPFSKSKIISILILFHLHHLPVLDTLSKIIWILILFHLHHLPVSDTLCHWKSPRVGHFLACTFYLPSPSFPGKACIILWHLCQMSKLLKVLLSRRWHWKLRWDWLSQTLITLRYAGTFKISKSWYG